MNYQAILPCAGTASRWWHSDAFPHKQLIPIGGLPLLTRTCQQLELRGCDPCIVAKSPLLPDRSSFAPSASVTLCHTIASTVSIWTHDIRRILVLLGDVFWHRTALDTILTDERPLQFYGLGSELFGFAFRPDERTFIDSCLARVISSQRNGMLWELYRACNGVRLDEKLVNTPTALLTQIADGWTQDFDYHDSYVKFIGRLKALDDQARADVLAL